MSLKKFIAGDDIVYKQSGTLYKRVGKVVETRPGQYPYGCRFNHRPETLYWCAEYELEFI